MKIEIIIPLITLCLTAISLFANNYWAMNREKRKEFKSRMDEIFELLREIEDKAVLFHTSDHYNEQVADEVKWRIKRMSMLSQSVSYFCKDSIISAFVSFKKSVMLENFNKSKFVKQSSNSAIVVNIHGNATRLFKEMLDIYQDTHKL